MLRDILSRSRAFVIVIFLCYLFSNCGGPFKKDLPDYGRLYLSPTSQEYRDSLAETYQHAVRIALGLGNTENNKIYIDSVLSELRWSSDSTSMRKLSSLALRFAAADKDEGYAAQVYNYMATFHHNYHHLDSTYYYYIKAENSYVALNDTLKIAENDFYQARLLYEIGLTMESESKVSKALLILEEYPDNPIHFEANQLLGLCLVDRNNTKEAEFYFLKAVHLMKVDLGRYKILTKERLHLALAVALGNMAHLYFTEGNYEEAISYGKEGLEFLGEDGHPSWNAFLTTLIAKASYILTKDPNEIAIVKENFKVDSLLKNPYHMADRALAIAEMYIVGGNQEEALKWSRKVYDITKANEMYRYTYVALSYYLENSDTFRKEDIQELIALQDRMVVDDNETRNTFARIAYETEVVVKENEKLKGNIILIVIIGIIIVLFLIIVTSYFRLKSKEKELKLIKVQQKTDEEINGLLVEKGLIAAQAKMQERDRIAKALHDGIVNSVFGIRFNLQQLSTSDSDTKELLVKELEKVEANTRSISHDLQSNKLFNDTQFYYIIEEFILFQKNKFNTQFKFFVGDDIEIEDFSINEKMNIYFIIREAIQNVNKHSQASFCCIMFVREEGGIEISIQDDGIGYEGVKGKGIGLKNMKDRAKLLDTTLVIESVKGQGTRVSLVIPNTKKEV